MSLYTSPLSKNNNPTVVETEHTHTCHMLRLMLNKPVIIIILQWFCPHIVMAEVTGNLQHRKSHVFKNHLLISQNLNTSLWLLNAGLFPITLNY